MFDVERAMRELVERNGAGLQLKGGARPLLRVYGELVEDDGGQQLSADDTHAALHELLHDESKLEEFAREFLELALVVEQLVQRSVRVICAQLLPAVVFDELSIDAKQRPRAALELQACAVSLHELAHSPLDVEHDLLIGGPRKGLERRRVLLDERLACAMRRRAASAPRRGSEASSATGSRSGGFARA